MLTPDQYSTVVFTAMRANAALIETLRGKEALGCYPKWNLASCQSLKVKSGLWSISVADYSSDVSVDIYNQLLDIGSTWFGGINFDDNAQNPIIEIVNVLSAPEPVDPINYSDFDPASQQPDTGRTDYPNPDWKGWNPVLSLTSPMESALRLGVDYTLLSGGGIQLLLTGNKPEIYPGETMRASSYQRA